MNNLVLIDGHNFLFRAYSVPFKFYSAKHTPLHVVTTYLGLVRKCVNLETTHIAVVFDTNTASDNHELFDGYKANRIYDYSDKEDTPFEHLEYIKAALSCMGVCCLEKPHTEADDIIATLSTYYTNLSADHRVHIASSDSDFYQLLNDQVHIIRQFPNGETRLLDDAYVFSKLGVKPFEYAYFKSLVGDKADNIDGVPHIGPMRAKKIINKEMAFDMKPYEALLKRNMQLVTLNRNVMMKCDTTDLEFHDDTFYADNRKIFSQCDF